MAQPFQTRSRPVPDPFQTRSRLVPDRRDLLNAPSFPI
jgi:hypothetical protein